MKAVVFYESVFDDTRVIAEAIRSGLTEFGDIKAADLMVIGRPTHVHGMSREHTRPEAVKWAAGPEKARTLETTHPDAESGNSSTRPVSSIVPGIRDPRRHSAPAQRQRRDPDRTRDEVQGAAARRAGQEFPRNQGQPTP